MSRIDAWNSDTLPIYEPGLGELIVKSRGVNLSFTTDIAGAIAESSMIFIAVNTPLREFGSLVSLPFLFFFLKPPPPYPHVK